MKKKILFFLTVILQISILCIPVLSAGQKESVKKPGFHFPLINPNHAYMRALLTNSFNYIDPKNMLFDSVSGYPFEGWNHDPGKGLYLRSFTQLTSIGKWLELMANIAAGYADNPYLSREEALKKLDLTVQSLIHDQDDPKVSSEGLMGNFLGLSEDGRQGPMARDTEKDQFTKEFGKKDGEAIWAALEKEKWISPQKDGTIGIIERGTNYGSEHFTNALEPFKSEETRKKIMDILDQRVVMVIFGDNANLSSSAAKAIGALLHPGIKEQPKVKEIRKRLEQFLSKQKQGYANLYDDKAGMFYFGWDATKKKYFGWEEQSGKWVTGHMNYFVSEFRGPELFVALNFGLPLEAIKNLSFQIKPYELKNKEIKYTLCPWSGSVFQALGLSLFMQEMKNPAWKKILENFVDIELDFTSKLKIPGFLSESYTGDGAEYSGNAGIPDIAVRTNGRILTAASLYTIGVAYGIMPSRVEEFLKKNWQVISGLFTGHGPWEGYHTKKKETIKFQTSAHTLSLILGGLGTGSENMKNYLDSKGLTESLKRVYKKGDPADLLSEKYNIIPWSAQGKQISCIKEKKEYHIKGSSLKDGGINFVIPGDLGENFSSGELRIRYQMNIPESPASFSLVLKGKKTETSEYRLMPNEIFLKMDNSGKQYKEISIPLPAAPALNDIKEILLLFTSSKEFDMDIVISAFEYKPL